MLETAEVCSVSVEANQATVRRFMEEVVNQHQLQATSMA